MKNLFDMSSLQIKKGFRTLLKIIVVYLLLFVSLPLKAAYVVHSVTGNVTLVADGKSIPLKKGMKVNPSDIIEISDKAEVEILNELDSKIYTSINTGKLSVMRIMLDAKQKASDNSANVGDFLTMGKSTAQTDGRIYVEKGMVKRKISFFQEDSLGNILPSANFNKSSILIATLNSLISEAPGCVGVALVSKDDTITFNNGVQYPMMSVFKLHQALAVTDKLERTNTPLDAVIHIYASEIDKNTWSSMLKEYENKDFDISVADLMKHAIISSDNNASNILFKRIVSPVETNKLVKTIAPDTTFQITFAESIMASDPELSYYNYTSPLSAALLMNKVFTTPFMSQDNQDSIKSYLTSVTTGHDRLGAAIKGEEGILFGHKTGSGYRNARGELIAHNDVGYFQLPDGRNYTLAVFIRDFNGNEEEASAIIANISRCVYNYFRTSQP